MGVLCQDSNESLLNLIYKKKIRVLSVLKPYYSHVHTHTASSSRRGKTCLALLTPVWV